MKKDVNKVKSIGTAMSKALIMVTVTVISIFSKNRTNR